MASWSNNGLSLVGVLISVVVLATTVLAVGRLLANRATLTSSSRETLVAVNLAREGLELTRAVRDTNWLLVNPGVWTTGLCDGQTEVMGDARSVREAMSLSAVRSNAQLYQASDGSFGHTPSGAPSPYRRIIRLDCSQATADPAFITVTATVSWQHEGRDRSVVLTEQLFNWLPLEVL